MFTIRASRLDQMHKQRLMTSEGGRKVHMNIPKKLGWDVKNVCAAASTMVLTGSIAAVKN